MLLLGMAALANVASITKEEEERKKKGKSFGCGGRNITSRTQFEIDD